MSQYVHHVPGRLRIKDQAFTNDPGLAQAVKECLTGIRGIDKVTCNPLTGSVVIRYNAETIPPQTLIDHLHACEHLEKSRTMPMDSHMGSVAAKIGGRIGQACLSTMLEQGLKGTGLSFLAAFV